MNYKNIVNVYSGLFICLIAFTAIAWSEGEEMNPLTLEDLLKFNTFVHHVPIDITSDGNWIAYNTQNREQLEGGGGDTAYPKMTVWVTNTRTGEHRNLTPDWGSSWAPRWSPDGTLLAFYSDRMGKLHLYVWNRESDDIQVFSSKTVQMGFGFEVPKWTPDGRFVLFKSVSSTDIPIDDESQPDIPQAMPKTSHKPPFVEIWTSPKRQFQEQEDPSEQENIRSSKKKTWERKSGPEYR